MTSLSVLAGRTVEALPRNFFISCPWELLYIDDLTLCLLCNFTIMLFFVVCWLFSKSIFLKILSGIQSECQTVWMQFDLGRNCLQSLLADVTGKLLGECFWYEVYKARLWEGLLTSQGLPSDSTSILKAEPGKLDIKRRKPGILFISLQADSLFKLAIIDFCADSMSLTTSFKRCNVIMPW